MAKNHFVDNKKLYEAYVEYRSRPEVQGFLARKAAHKKAKDAGKAQGKFGETAPPLPRYIGECIWLIANNYARKPNWRHLPYLDEMISDAIFFTLKYGYNFDPTKSKYPFSYLTEGVNRAFLQRIAKEKHQGKVEKEMVRGAASGQIASYSTIDGSVPLGATTHVMLLSKHYDDVETLDLQTGTNRKKEKKSKEEKKHPNAVDEALDV